MSRSAPMIFSSCLGTVRWASVTCAGARRAPEIFTTWLIRSNCLANSARSCCVRPSSSAAPWSRTTSANSRWARWTLPRITLSKSVSASQLAAGPASGRGNTSRRRSTELARTSRSQGSRSSGSSRMRVRTPAARRRTGATGLAAQAFTARTTTRWVRDSATVTATSRPSSLLPINSSHGSDRAQTPGWACARRLTSACSPSRSVVALHDERAARTPTWRHRSRYGFPTRAVAD